MGEAIEAQRAEMTHPTAHRLSVSEASLHCAAGIVHPQQARATVESATGSRPGLYCIQRGIT